MAGGGGGDGHCMFYMQHLMCAGALWLLKGASKPHGAVRLPSRVLLQLVCCHSCRQAVL